MILHLLLQGDRYELVGDVNGDVHEDVGSIGSSELVVADSMDLMMDNLKDAEDGDNNYEDNLLLGDDDNIPYCFLDGDVAKHENLVVDTHLQDNLVADIRYMNHYNNLDLLPESYQHLVMNHLGCAMETPVLLALEKEDPYHLSGVAAAVNQQYSVVNAFVDRLELLQKDQSGSMVALFYLK